MLCFCVSKGSKKRTEENVVKPPLPLCHLSSALSGVLLFLSGPFSSRPESSHQQRVSHQLCLHHLWLFVLGENY